MTIQQNGQIVFKEIEETENNQASISNNNNEEKLIGYEFYEY